MGKKETYESRSEAYLMGLAEELNLELVDVEYVRESGTWYLRAYLDKEGGITIDDCEEVSRRFGDWLDREDFISESYMLEVSSPGLDRPLKKEKDFARSLGKDIELRLYAPQEGQKEFRGSLEAYDKETVTLGMEDGSRRTFARKDASLIRLAFDF